MKNVSTVLVANRGEIALRIIRGIHDYGSRSVAVYADQDRDASFVDAADLAFSLDGSTAAQTYLNADKILGIAQRSGADAIHPGYGFLAEDPAFAEQVSNAGLTWIGPSGAAIARLGDKVQARRTALSVGVQPVPGTEDPLSSRTEVENFISQFGFPIVIKRADGGGGRGITVIREESDLNDFFSGRSEDSLGAFFVEKFIERARHIETQCGRDSHGNFAVYSTRDCTVQRRHQKLIEEAPAPFLDKQTQEVLSSASRQLFEGVDYVGLGTCEFLLDTDGSLYFLEVNPRLQVEHTVTEEVSGVDLVGQQLLIASGRKLTPPPAIRGHSIEFRITSEDPAQDFAPSLGALSSITWPTGPGIRIDTGVEAGDEIAPDFDSMVAKLIVTGENRDHALKRATRALSEISIQGIATPLPAYQAILETDDFRTLSVWTRWLEEHFLTQFLETYSGEPASSGTAPPSNELTHFIIEIDGQRHDLAVPANLFAGTNVSTTPRPPQPLRSGRAASKAISEAGDEDTVTSPLQAIVVRLCVEAGQEVEADQLVVVLESMKMEKHLYAPRAGIVEEILVSAGENVTPNQALLRLAERNDQ
ncbi:ATP-grasp domain-containing protein [Actinomycetaceae bacterium WB03_NA08]|uniref:biotin carboxylase n=1 Tax=Scrofimicrobium canadense TaxID=2652290 RepID=A0A6N7VT15_9ACTO|nr:biotin carboxylase N-terminal domain-containing protein [Scrofimicrobium canadense]MSS84919.1 ATP-grasp domain-containing protein [Scrofimicrobium canadense]